MTRRPTIGVTASVETVTAGDWTDESAMVPMSYARAVQRAGGRPVLLVPDPDDAERPEELLELVDGLILSGAIGDVDPRRYGAPPHPATQPVSPERDAFELSLVRAAAAADIPVLGICRGMQVINVAYGGTLDQHLADRLDDDQHRGEPGTFAEHEVRTEPGSLAARAAGGERSRVQSFHHQGMGEVREPLRPSAWAQGDDVVEAVEDPARRFVLGVGWHPEEDEASRVVSALVEEARR